MSSEERPVSERSAIESVYDIAAPGFDDRFAAARETVSRFHIIDDVQRRAAQGARSVLELGVGTARLLGTIEAPLRAGIDISLPMLIEARQKVRNVVRGDAHDLPFADGSFDAILAGNAVFRYLDYDHAFREAARVLRVGGRLCVHQYAQWTLSPRSLFRSRTGDARHVSEPDELRRPARRYGLTEIDAYFWRNLPFAPYAIRVPSLLRLWSHLTLVFEKRLTETTVT